MRHSAAIPVDGVAEVGRARMEKNNWGEKEDDDFDRADRVHRSQIFGARKIFRSTWSDLGRSR